MDVVKLSGLRLNEEELQKATERLCIFGASGSGEYVRELQEFLSLHSLALLDPGFRSFYLIYAKVKELIDFPLEFDDILQALSRLTLKGEIECRGALGNPESEYRMQVQKISQLRNQVKEQDKFEKTVIDQWREELNQKYTSLTENDLDNLVEDLKSYTLRILGQHAVESLSLYYGDEQDILNLVDKFADENLSDILPEREIYLTDIRNIELPMFFKVAPIERKQYIASKMNSVFILHLLQLDPACASLAKAQIPGGKLYLDTNFIYRLVGLQGPALYEAAKRLKELSSGLGYEMVVTPRTIDEYKTSIQYSLRRVRQAPKIIPALARVAIQATDINDMLTAYWRQISTRGVYIEPETFYGYWIHIEDILSKHDVRVVDDIAYQYVIQHDPDVAREEWVLENSINRLGRSVRHPDITNHDAFHRLLILRLRGGSQNNSFIETRYWFLTCDSKLPRYDRIARGGTDLTTPYCVLASQWLQAIRPLAPTIEGFDAAQVESLDSAYLRIYKSPPSGLLNDIMSRFAMSPTYIPEVAAKMFLDNQFLEQFERARTEEDKEKIIDDFYEKYIDSLEAEKREAIEERDRMARRVKELESLTPPALPQFTIYTDQAVFGNAQHQKEVTMGNKTTISNVSGSIINVDSLLEQVSQNINNVQKADQATKEELNKLVAQLTDVLKGLPSDKIDEATKIADRVDTAISEVSKEKPDKEKVEFSLESLKKAAQNIAGVLPTVLPIATQIAEHIQKLIA